MKGNEGGTVEGDLEVIVITDEWKLTTYYTFGLTKYQEPKYRVFSPKVAELKMGRVCLVNHQPLLFAPIPF